METIDLIIQSATAYYDEIRKDRNSRYRSWEYCYKDFYYSRDKSSYDEDHLSLHLAFYLASWGMYRASSFLLQQDYKVHIPIIKELLNHKYDCLVGIDCKSLKEKENQERLNEINNFIKEYYDKIRKRVKAKNVQKDISDTLTSKILLGTLGCVPAYDRFFIIGVKKEKVTTGTYNIASLLRLVDFYDKNNERLEEIRNKLEFNKLPYPQMKLLDMGFWQIGFDADNT